MRFRYNIFDIEFICFVLINLIYLLWLILALFYGIFMIIPLLYIDANTKFGGIDVIVAKIILVLMALIPLLHICLKNFYLYFLAKKILKKGAFKYRKFIKKINDSAEIKRNILTTAILADVVIISLVTTGVMLDKEYENFILVILSFASAHFIFGGFFLPYFTLFKLLGIDKKELYRFTK